MVTCRGTCLFDLVLVTRASALGVHPWPACTGPGRTPGSHPGGPTRCLVPLAVCRNATESHHREVDWCAPGKPVDACKARPRHERPTLLAPRLLCARDKRTFMDGTSTLQVRSLLRSWYVIKSSEASEEQIQDFRLSVDRLNPGCVLSHALGPR